MADHLDTPRQSSSFCILIVDWCQPWPVPGEGLEPTLLAEPDPKSGASANFATRAMGEKGILNGGVVTSNKEIMQHGENFSRLPTMMSLRQSAEISLWPGRGEEDSLFPIMPGLE